MVIFGVAYTDCPFKVSNMNFEIENHFDIKCVPVHLVISLWKNEIGQDIESFAYIPAISDYVSNAI